VTVDDLVLELDDGQGAPLRLFPSAAEKPLLHLGDQPPQVLRIRLEHLGKTKFNILISILAQILNDI
jgi:hypothetical protein